MNCNISDKEVDERKIELDYMLGESTTISKQQRMIMELLGEFKELKETER